MKSVGAILILVGLVWTLQTLGAIDSSIWNVIIPLILFYMGFMLLAKNCGSECMVCHYSSPKKVTKKKK